MAKNNGNILLQGTSGQIGKQLVIKQYSYGVVVSKYPDMSGVVLTKKQKHQQSRFAKAVAFAQSINNNPITKKEWKEKYPNALSVFNAAIKWYMENEK